jgi:hypothetical protein
MRLLLKEIDVNEAILKNFAATKSLFQFEKKRAKGVKIREEAQFSKLLF